MAPRSATSSAALQRGNDLRTPSPRPGAGRRRCSWIASAVGSTPRALQRAASPRRSSRGSAATTLFTPRARASWSWSAPIGPIPMTRSRVAAPSALPLSSDTHASGSISVATSSLTWSGKASRVGRSFRRRGGKLGENPRRDARVLEGGAQSLASPRHASQRRQRTYGERRRGSPAKAARGESGARSPRPPGGLMTEPTGARGRRHQSDQVAAANATGAHLDDDLAWAGVLAARPRRPARGPRRR